MPCKKVTIPASGGEVPEEGVDITNLAIGAGTAVALWKVGQRLSERRD